MKIAFPTDEHHPYSDESARLVALKIVRDFAPDLLIAGSDALDFYAISSFDKNPARMKTNLQDEINAYQRSQKEWNDAAPDARKFYLVGNHEDRLRRYLWRHPEMFGLEALSLPNLLGLPALGIEWEWNKKDLANQELVLYDRLVIKHGSFIRSYSAMSGKAEADFERYALSTLTGHTHRGGVFYTRTRAGIIQAIEGFCLCSLEPEYIRYPDWQQGIVLVEVDENSLQVEPIVINTFRGRKQAIWRGKEYMA